MTGRSPAIQVSAVSGLRAESIIAVRDRLSGSHRHLPVIEYSTDDHGDLIRSVRRGRIELDREPVELIMDCQACSIQLDLTRRLGDYAFAGWGSVLLVCLPPGVSASAVIDAVDALDLDGDPVGPGSITTAVDPASLSETLWSAATLADLGVAVGHNDQPCGEFVVEELLLCDSYVHVVDRLDPDDRDQTLGIELTTHIAPQSRATMISTDRRPVPLPAPVLGASRFDPVEVAWRTSPATIMIPLDHRGDQVRTFLAQTRRPLHPARLEESFTDLAAGCVWTRGRLWIASIPERKLGWTGIGPKIGFSDCGPWLADRADRPGQSLDTEGMLNWHSRYGDRGTWLAFTGEEVDPADLEAGLARCALTDQEYALGPRGWSRYPDPLRLRESFGHDHAASTDLRI
ncbi:GTP-binding protein [Microlunatus sp. GCM10028923]|uniref:GTP-binding protein n=1 Tax=Microlunatus sp. GCM10028923 TaxID=3273400 RepID=UPI003621AE15